MPGWKRFLQTSIPVIPICRAKMPGWKSFSFPGNVFIFRAKMPEWIFWYFLKVFHKFNPFAEANRPGWIFSLVFRSIFRAKRPGWNAQSSKAIFGATDVWMFSQEIFRYLPGLTFGKGKESPVRIPSPVMSCRTVTPALPPDPWGGAHKKCEVYLRRPSSINIRPDIQSSSVNIVFGKNIPHHIPGVGGGKICISAEVTLGSAD